MFSRPRCADRRVVDDRPRWSGAHYGGTRVHAFNVQSGVDGSGFGNPGLCCTTRHLSSYSNILHGQPGTDGWHLASTKMARFGRSSPEFCTRIKDPAASNGGHSLQDVALYARDDKLAAWGWARWRSRVSARLGGRHIRDDRKWIATRASCPVAQ
ncbi:hypothetical protein X743_33075 [Mesorhizobium sp. LNHC252B00]|nr:hypothetical protein X743_33075 [Mesorhizobium sp. LNHC252B00]